MRPAPWASETEAWRALSRPRASELPARGQADAGTPTQPGATRAPLLVLGLGLAVIGLSGATKDFDSDGFWHLRTGEWILDHHRLPRRGIFSWSAPDAAWRLNSWLFDVVIGALDRFGGLGAVSLLPILLLCAFGVVLYGLARSLGAGQWRAVVVTLAVTFLAFQFSAQRPQCFSYLLFPIVIYVARAALHGRARALPLLGVLVAVWSNIHLTFTAAVGLIGLLAAIDVVTHRRLAQPFRVAAVAVVAGLCNPYGIGAYTASLGVRSASKAVGIQEWQAIDPTKLLQQFVIIVFVLGALALLHTGRWRKPDIVIPIGLFVALALDARRNIPFALALVAPEIALAAPALHAPAVRRWVHARREPLFVGVIVGLVALFVVQVPLVSHLSRVDRETYPVRAVEAIPSGCRLLNEYEHGGYIMYARPDVLVSIDGRNDMYGEDRVREQARVVESEGDWRTWLDDHHVDCVLVGRDRPLATALAASGWTVLVREDAGVLLARA